MTNKKLIRIGTLMGLNFDENSNFPHALKKGRVVFDGCNGQRFLIESSWEDDKIHSYLGMALIAYGKRLKAMEISNAISINSD